MKKSGANSQEQKVYGHHACSTLFKQRPSDIIKAVIIKEKLSLYTDLVKYLAQHKKAYQLATEDEIETFSKSTHHEGICLLSKSKKITPLAIWKKNAQNRNNILILALDQIENPHNLGAIIRSAAHFAVDAIFYQANRDLHLDGSVARVAQGGCEYVDIFRVADWNELTQWCSATKTLIFTTSDKAKESLGPNSCPARCCMVLGSEARGLSTYWNKIASQLVKIDGTNVVQSLNVSVAADILCATYRQKYACQKYPS